MANKRDYYEVLGVGKNATEEEIRLSPVVSSRNVIIIIGENLNKEYINEIWRDFCSVVSL